MITRRLFCGCVAAGFSFAATAVHAQSQDCAVFTPDRQKATTPDDAIARLKTGNGRFTAGKSVNCDLMTQVKQTASDQSPYAAIVGCIDSRVPPELVFDQRIGDVFCARVAGNIVNTDIIGSLEYSTKVAGAKAIVVLAPRTFHYECRPQLVSLRHARAAPSLCGLSRSPREPAQRVAALRFTLLRLGGPVLRNPGAYNGSAGRKDDHVRGSPFDFGRVSVTDRVAEYKEVCAVPWANTLWLRHEFRRGEGDRPSMLWSHRCLAC